MSCNRVNVLLSNASAMTLRMSSRKPVKPIASRGAVSKLTSCPAPITVVVSRSTSNTPLTCVPTVPIGIPKPPVFNVVSIVSRTTA